MRRNCRTTESILLGIIIAIAAILLLNSSGQKAKQLKTNVNVVEMATKGGLPQQEYPHEELKISCNTGNVPSSISVEVSREVLCLFTVLYIDEVRHEEYEPDVPLPLTKFFITLFQTFISPNAP